MGLKVSTRWEASLSRGCRLKFGPGVAFPRPSARTLGEMREVLYHQGDEQRRFPDLADDARQLYFMYRGVATWEDLDQIRLLGLRYDLTVIPPGVLGRELVKTAGHYHPPTPDGSPGYPEVYEVLHGTANYLFQRVSADGRSVAAVLLIEAGPGDKVVIPPGFGHVTINPGPGVLVMANWVEATFRSLYGPLMASRGAAYYRLAAGEWVANPSYEKVATLRRVHPCPRPELGLVEGVPLYDCALTFRDQIRFLVEPRRAAGTWEEMYSLPA